MAAAPMAPFRCCRSMDRTLCRPQAKADGFRQLRVDQYSATLARWFGVFAERLGGGFPQSWPVSRARSRLHGLGLLSRSRSRIGQPFRCREKDTSLRSHPDRRSRLPPFSRGSISPSASQTRTPSPIPFRREPTAVTSPSTTIPPTPVATSRRVRKPHRAPFACQAGSAVGSRGLSVSLRHPRLPHRAWRKSYRHQCRDHQSLARGQSEASEVANSDGSSVNAQGELCDRWGTTLFLPSTLGQGDGDSLSRDGSARCGRRTIS